MVKEPPIHTLCHSIADMMWSSSSISVTPAPKRGASATSFPSYGIKTTLLTIIALVLMCLGALYQNDTINVASINNNMGTVKDDASSSSVDGPVGKEAINMKVADFGILGFPKTGTSFLLHVLGKHPEITMPAFETCELSKFDKLKKENIFLIAAQQSEDERTPPTRYGFKCPKMIRETNLLENFVPISNETRLVVGVRHPVLWFQSHYNYKVEMYHQQLGNGKTKRIPSPLELTGKNYKWQDVSVKYARFDIYLKQLAKTSLTDKEMKEMFNHENIWEKRLTPIPNKVFIYTIDQMSDHNETRKMKWQKDLHTYLQLKAPFDWSMGEEERSSKKKEKTTFNETINICDEKYSTIRSELTRQGREASKWISEKFITSPDVVVSDALFFKSALREWANDPCHVQKESD